MDVRLKSAGWIAAKATVEHVTERVIDKSSDLPWGKTSRIRDHCRETTVRLKNEAGIEWDVVLRAYDEGIALRYGFPAQDKLRNLVIEDEATEFRLANDPTGHVHDVR